MEEGIKILKRYTEDNICIEFNDLRQAISNVLNELERKNKIINKIKEYAHQEIVHYDETIKDYIDDDKVGNADYIGELKETKEIKERLQELLGDE